MRREFFRLTTGARNGAARSLFPLILVLVAFILPALRPGPDADVFWHLRAGDDLIDGNPGAFREAWSYTASGAAWINHEWLAEFLFAPSDGPAAKRH